MHPGATRCSFNALSASWLVAGNGLRMGSGEPTEFPTNVNEVVAMFGQGKG
jgi:hypothetical protein